MSQADLGAERPAVVVSKHRGVKTPSSAKRPVAKTVRQQLHLSEQTAKRLAVHAALVGRNSSRVADKILGDYLRKSGKGREIFPSDPTESVEPDDE